MEYLVSLYKGKEARVSTWDIWQGFGYTEHRAFKKVIWSNKELFESKGDLITSTGKDVNRKKGRPDESYLLNERQFFMLVMLAKNTPESVELKDRIEKEFFRMRSALAQAVANHSNHDWLNSRKDGKQVYFQKTDVIKSFVDYATEHGSKSANLYYCNIAKMENAALFIFEQKYPNMREVMSIRQLMQVATADQIVEKALQDGMNLKMPYKDIYVMAKDRVIQFSSIIGKSLVVEMQDKLLTIDKNALN